MVTLRLVEEKKVISDLLGKITAVSVRNNRAHLRMVENVAAAAETY